MGAVEVRFHYADLIKITTTDLGSGFTLMRDIGRFAELDAGRRRAAATITQVAAPGARLLVLALDHPHPPLGSSGYQ